MVKNNYNLPTPTAIETLSYESILEENISYLKELLPKWEPVESDTYMLLLESLSYKELHNRTQDNLKIQKMLPHLSSGADLDNFIFGFYGGVKRVEDESDEEFMDRALLSVNRFSTAGSVESYEYHTYRASAKVDDVKVVSPSAGEVVVYIASMQDIDESVAQTVFNGLDDEKVRPLTDKLSVELADIKAVSINATLSLFDMAQQEMIDESIKQNFKQFFKIGEDVTYSQTISKLHLNGVYEVVTDISEDIVVDDLEVLKIELVLEYKEAVVR